MHVSLNARAENDGNRIFYMLCFFTRQRCQDLTNGITARRALTRWNIRIGNHRFGVIFAPGETTGASVGTGKAILDLLYLRIKLHGEFAGCNRKANAKQEPD
jgi:hypothetical protein